MVRAWPTDPSHFVRCHGRGWLLGHPCHHRGELCHQIRVHSHQVSSDLSLVVLSSDSDRGCVLSSNVVVGAQVTIAPFTRVGSCKHPDEEVAFSTPTLC
jgi:acetyltransferase-like isoleucine patch superfamily enzyme